MESFRIRTNLGIQNTNIKFKLDQTFDNLEILSLKINQNNFYRSFTSDYGVLVGRVIANGGLGVPNARVSVFIPLDNIDLENPNIAFSYPYKQVTDKNNLGTRYNLLPKESKIITIRRLDDSGNKPGDLKNQIQPWKIVKINSIDYWEATVDTGYGPETGVGTLPSPEEITSNEDILYIYKKYYKYVTKTNESGDYMIFGVPIGQHSIHMDLDLSDIGKYTFSADALIANGYPKTSFSQNGINYAFKGTNILETLPQIISQNHTVNIISLWGDSELGEVGITRHDFEVQFSAEPVAYLAFNILFDPDNDDFGRYEKKGYDTGGLRGLAAPGRLIRVESDDTGSGVNIGLEISEYNSNGIKLSGSSSRYIHDKTTGECIVILPCNQEKLVTDEYGNQVTSTDPNKGIGSTGYWSVKIISVANDNVNTKARYRDAIIQKLPGSTSNNLNFKYKSNNVYTVKTTATRSPNGGYYSLKHDGDGTIYRDGEWLQGVVYLGRGKFDGAMDWLDKGSDLYNVEHYTVNITDYLDILINKTPTVEAYHFFTTINKSQISDAVNNLKLTESRELPNVKYDSPGEINGSYLFYRGFGTRAKDTLPTNIYNRVKKLKG